MTHRTSLTSVIHQLRHHQAHALAKPVIVFENGLAADMQHAWTGVLHELGPEHATLTYNRPGIGGSPSATTPSDGLTIVAGLRDLLQALALRPPYLLVGHSLGGLYLQLYARQYPEEVAGLLLIDPTHPCQFEGPGAWRQRPWWFRLAFWLFLRYHGGSQEFAAAAQTGQQVLAAPAWHNPPTLILLSGPAHAPPFQSALLRHDRQLKESYAALYPGSELRWLDCGHDIPRERPQAVATALRELVTRCTPPATTAAD